MCANQRSKKRNQLVGAYVTPELKEKIVKAAEYNGLTVADYVRMIIKENTEETYATDNEKQK
jgi:hypothetical protein